MYYLVYTPQALKDAKKIGKSTLLAKTQKLLKLIEKDPLHRPPAYEKLVGDLAGAYSRRINFQHRLVYQVYEAKKVVKVIRMWSHYE